MTGLNIVGSATCMRQLCCDEEFNKVWDVAASAQLSPTIPQTETQSGQYE